MTTTVKQIGRELIAQQFHYSESKPLDEQIDTFKYSLTIPILIELEKKFRQSLGNPKGLEVWIDSYQSDGDDELRFHARWPYSAKEQAEAQAYIDRSRKDEQEIERKRQLARIAESKKLLILTGYEVKEAKK
jgi:hypothetical protein